MTKRPHSRPARDLLWLFAGPMIWFLGFSLLYGAETIVCLAPRPAAMPVAASVVLVLTFGALALLGRGVARREPPGDTGSFMRGATWLLIGLATLATLWMGAPLLLLDACVPPAA